MKRTIIFATIAALAMHVGAIVIDNNAGQLEENISDYTLSSLTITGTIDARDFKFIGDKLTQLSELNLSQAEIVAYSDPQRTLMNGITNYEALTLPQTMLMNSSLSTIVLPSNLQSIGQAALAGCNQLTSITLPEGLKSIGAYAFNGTGLTAITIPEQVTIIGEGAFSHCLALESASISNAAIGNYAFIGDTMLSSVVIGNGVNSIGNGSFSGCTSLATITLNANNSISTIGSEAFAGSGLTTIDLHAMPQLTSIGAWAFSNTPLQVIDVPSTVTTMGEGAFYYASQLAQVNLPMYAKINDFTFAGNSSLVSPRLLLEGTEVIGNYAFYGNTAADTLLLPSTIQYIGTRAMAGMTGLKEIIVLGDVALLGDSVWAGVDQPNVNLNTQRDNVVSNEFAQADQWRDFHVMLEYLLGDVNADTRINVLDITTTIEYILNNNPAVFLFAAADVVRDNKINVLDVTGIVGLIMEHIYTTVYANPNGSTPMVETDDELTVENLNLRPGETTTVSICLNNSQNYTAMQFDMMLTEGLELDGLNISTTDRTSHHSTAIEKCDENTYRIIAFAPDNSDITGFDGAVLELNVRATDQLSGTSGIKLEHICMADRYQDYAIMPSFTPVSTITGVDDISKTVASVRGDRGMVIIEANEPMTAQIVNTSGMSITVNVSQGSNTYMLDSGIYMVRIGSKTYKIVVK